MNRRALFKKLLGAAAVVALAPQLAFRVPAPKPALDLHALLQHCYQLKRSRDAAGSEFIDIFIDQHTANAIRRKMAEYYETPQLL